MESGKAAAVAAAGGLAGYLPFFLLAGSSAPSGLQGLLSLGAAVAGCVLFGVTYRYAVRQDADNLQVGPAGGKHVCALFGSKVPVLPFCAATARKLSVQRRQLGSCSLKLIGHQ